ncbi:MAG: protein kinase [Acidobacteriota bacterium]
MSERDVRLRSILAQAIDLSPSERTRYVHGATDDDSLRAEVLELLAGIEEIDDFLEEPAVGLVARDGDTVFDRPGASQPSTSNEAPPPPDRVGPYRIDARLGGGGMGVVYRGFDTRLERPVALKQIRAGYGQDDARRRFHREARAVARLDHPSIVRVHDWIEHETGDWLILELVDGRHLREVLDADGPMKPARAVQVASEIAGALGAAHDAGILHRDLKPENVMLTSGGDVKLLDFGLAKHIASVDLSIVASPSLLETLTAEGRILGTVSAMSPEQAMGDPLDERSDLFALGSLFYRLLTGAPPFDGGAPVATMRATVFDPHPPLPESVGAPPALVRLLDQLLQKKRQDRPQNARQVQSQLRDIAAALQQSASASTDVPTAQRSERRPITLLAAGLSPELEGTSPEELLEIVPRLDAAVVEVVERWGGRLEGRMGDRWIACFGVPQAREDDARRAVHAGLDLLAEAPTTGAPLAVGVHSGMAVTTRVAGREELALGPVFDAATDVQSRSRGRVLVSAETRRRAGRFFQLEAAPASSFAVLGMASETDVRTAATVPIWGRAGEVARLHEAFDGALAGRGRVILLSGEAGIGKTRLLATLRSAMDEIPGQARWLELHGVSVRRASPFQAVVRHLRRLLDLPEDASPDRQVAALEAWVEELELPPEEMVPHLAALLGVSDAYPGAVNLDPRLRKRRIQETLATLWLEAAEQRPVVFVVEDVQWLDPSSVDLLSLVLEQVPTVPMLLVLTHRLEYEPPWSARGHISEIRLERLDLAAAQRLVTSVAGAPLPRGLVERIAKKADGVPLYVEELTRVVLEGGHLRLEDGRYELDQPLERLVIPATLEESLAARLEQLGESAPAVAQVASVIGREFSHRLLGEVSEESAAALEAGVERLTDADLVYRKGFGRRTRYFFRHALIQDAAYASLLRSERRAIHRRVASALAESTPPTPADVIAHHLSGAGAWGDAIAQWQVASTSALLASAHREAESHIRRGIADLAKLRGGRARDLAELTLLTQLGRALAGLRGYSASEVLETYERAAELCTQLDDAEEAARITTQVTWGLWAFYSVRSDIPRALVHGRRLLRMAEQHGTTSDWMVAHSSMAVATYFGGDLEACYRHSEAAIDHEAANPDRALSTASPQDLGVNALSSLALAAWHRGRGDEATAWAERALELARHFKHPYSEVFAGSWAARLYQSRRRPVETLGLADSVVEISERHGFFWATQGFFFRGCAQVQAARDAGEPIPEGALELMGQGLAAYRATGARLSVSYMLAQVAEARLWRGELDEASTLLEEARDATAEGLESYWRPELDRLAGEVARERGELDTAAEHFRAGIERARATGDHALALRSTLSWARLLRGRGDLAAARRGLEAALAPMTADDERDVVEARGMLESLASAGAPSSAET